MDKDIVTRLSDAQAECDLSPCDCQCYLHQDAIDAIVRLRADLTDCNNDFHHLAIMFEQVRAERDHLRAICGTTDTQS